MVVVIYLKVPFQYFHGATDKITRDLSQSGWYPGRNSNHTISGHKFGAPPLHQTSR